MMTQMMLLGASRPPVVTVDTFTSAYVGNTKPCNTVGPTPALSPGASASGGSGSYTYLWARTAVNHAGANYTISSATSQTPTWSATVCNEAGDETWVCTATDTVTLLTGDSANVTVALEHEEL